MGESVKWEKSNQLEKKKGCKSERDFTRNIIILTFLFFFSNVRKTGNLFRKFMSSNQKKKL